MRGLLKVRRSESSVKILRALGSGDRRGNSALCALRHSRHNSAQQLSLDRKPGREFADQLAIQLQRRARRRAQ